MNRQVVAQPETKSEPPIIGGLLQRKCACGQHTGGGECEECRRKKHGLQRQRGHSAETTDVWPASVPPSVHSVLSSSGHPLDPETREFFEPRFGHVVGMSRAHSPSVAPQKMEISQPEDAQEREADQIAERVLGSQEPTSREQSGQGSRYDLSRVRIHADPQAAQSVNALAFTVGQHIVFRDGISSLGSSSGRRLLAHELAHTTQQARGLARQPGPGPLRPHDPQPKFSQVGACLGSAICKDIETPLKLLEGAKTDASEAGREKRKRLCGKVPPDPGCRADGHARRAAELEELLNIYDPARLKTGKGIFVHKDMEADFGALTVTCKDFVPPLAPDGHCITVPEKLEEEAKLFNHTTDPKVAIGGMERRLWRERALEKLVHEAGHTKFRASFQSGFQDQFSTTLPNILGKPRATCRKDGTSQVNVFSSLNELTAMLQEFPLLTARVSPSGGLTADEKEAELERWRGRRIRGTKQAITVSLRVVRCLCGCEDADDMIRETIQFATASWTPNEKNQLHREMRDPKWTELDLRWPFIAPGLPEVMRPAPERKKVP